MARELNVERGKSVSLSHEEMQKLHELNQGVFDLKELVKSLHNKLDDAEILRKQQKKQVERLQELLTWISFVGMGLLGLILASVSTNVWIEGIGWSLVTFAFGIMGLFVVSVLLGSIFYAAARAGASFLARFSSWRTQRQRRNATGVIVDAGQQAKKSQDNARK